MTVTLILLTAILVLAAVLLQDWRIRRERRRDRAIVRRLQRYLDHAAR